MLAQIHEYVRTVEPPDGAADDIAHPVLEFRENKLLFGAPDVLHEGLLGILGRDAAETHRGDFYLDLFARLGLRLDPPGVEHGNLVMLGDDLLGHDQLGKGANIATLLVNHHAQLARWSHCLLGGGQKRFLDRRAQDISIDALLAFPEFQDC